MHLLCRIRNCAGFALVTLAYFVTAYAQGPSANVTVVATGLNNPRGLVFGPDGSLYVAEGGAGGTLTTTPEDCTQVPAPVGPYSGGFTARISKFDRQGNRTTVADGLAWRRKETVVRESLNEGSPIVQ